MNTTRSPPNYQFTWAYPSAVHLIDGRPLVRILYQATDNDISTSSVHVRYGTALRLVPWSTLWGCDHRAEVEFHKILETWPSEEGFTNLHIEEPVESSTY